MTTTVRRVVTGHDETGKAIVLMDAAAGKVKVRPGTGIGATLLWVTDETPSDMSSHADAAEREIGVPPPINGSIFRTVEFPPEKDAGSGVGSGVKSAVGKGVGSGVGNDVGGAIEDDAGGGVGNNVEGTFGKDEA